MFIENGDLYIENCSFLDNVGTAGAGIYSARYSSLRVIGSVFSGNFAGSGAAFTTVSTPERSDLPAEIINSVFVGNETFGPFGAAAVESGLSGSVRMTNCILFHNFNHQAVSIEAQQLLSKGNSEIIINHSCVEGWTGEYGGVGNIGLDPLFVDPDGPDDIPGTKDDNMRLGRGSPCIDAGDNAALPLSITTDLDGRPRFANDPLAPDVGVGPNPIIDMGAYERQIARRVIRSR